MTKNQTVVDYLVAQTKKTSKALRFDHLVIRLTPLNKKAQKEMPSLLETFEKYRVMVKSFDAQ